MPASSTMHFYFNWAKERIDEMDAALASLEASAKQVRADAKVKADQSIADLKKRRSEFEELAKKQVEAGEAAWQRARPQLEGQWNEFESQLKAYVDTAGKQIAQQQATFREVAAAQVRAWREAAEKLRDEGAKMPAANRPDIDSAVTRMKAEAAEVDARLQQLKQVGNESWSAFSTALAESRKAFDRANQAAWDALKRAGAPKS
jgi:DNA repair exonuclease SbcCD ATPase subunit